MLNYVVSLDQLENMKHCIGFSGDKVCGRKNRKYTAYRNYFTTSDNNQNWDNLVVQGLAEKEAFPAGHGNNPQIYTVTNAGIEFLSRITDVTITEGD